MSKRIVESKLPIVFEPASTESAASSVVIGRVPGGAVRFRSDSISIEAGETFGPWEIKFSGATGGNPRPADLETSQTNYLLGKDSASWRTHVPNYAKVIYSNLYPGVDAVFYGNGSHLEHDFIVKPGSDYRQIRMHFSAPSRVQIGKDGVLAITRAGSSLQLAAPSIYQNVNGARQKRQGAFTILADGDVSFAVADYDPHLDLIIDPVLDFSTYLSPLGSAGLAVAADAAGNTYVAGYGSLGYPVTAGSFAGCASCTSSNVVTFVSKLSADGSKLLYSTVLGGNEFAQPTGIAVDRNGDAIVSGWTGSNDFPTKSGQAILPQNNNYVGFLVSLSPDGSSLNYGTLLGPSPTATYALMTYAAAVAVDTSGNAYVTGETGDGFFISAGALNQAVASNSNYDAFDVFLAKFSPIGALVYSAVLGTADPQNGGGGPIGASAIAVDAVGNAYVAGQAGTLWPITNGAYLSQIAGPMPYATPFVMKVAPDAKSVLYSTYLNYAYKIAGLSVLPDGNVFVVGNDAGDTYPTTADAFEPNNGKNGSAFLTELNAAGSGLAYSTMLCGGPGFVNGIALDAKGNIWLAEQISNPDFPLVSPLQGTFPVGAISNQPASALMELDPSGKTVEFSTFLGGAAQGFASSVAVDPNLRVHVTGAASYGMYTTTGVYAGSVPVPGPGYAGSFYPYADVIDPTLPSAALCARPNGGLDLAAALGTSTESRLTITSCGAEPLSITGFSASESDFSVPAPENTCPPTLPVGQSCTVNVRYAPTVGGPSKATLSIASNSPIPAMLTLNGQGVTAPVLTLSANSLTFGPQLVGTESAPQTIKITNTGNAILNGIGFGVTLTDEAAFPLTYTCDPSLAPGDSCTFSVQFKPVVTGTTSGTLTVEGTAAGLFQQVSLSGTSPQTPFTFGTQAGGSTSSTVPAGSTATYALSINPAGGFSGTIQLSCSNLPINSSCIFSPASLPASGGSPVNFTLSIATQSNTATASWRTERLDLALAGLICLIPLGSKRRRAVGMICLGALVVIAGVNGCGGGASATTGTTTQSAAKVFPGNYTINVLASDSSGNKATQSVTLIVQ